MVQVTPLAPHPADGTLIETAAVVTVDDAFPIHDPGWVHLVDDRIASIGAGAAVNCQLLNAYDLIGAFDTFKPKFAKRYGNINEVATSALEAYVSDVRNGVFPDADHTYAMDPAEAAALAAALGEEHT